MKRRARNAAIAALVMMASGMAHADSPLAKACPAQTGCGDPYIKLDGVCIHTSAMHPNPSQMKKAIDENRKSGRFERRSRPMPKCLPARTNSAGRQSLRLADYQANGVWVVTADSTIVKAEGEQAAELISDMKDRVDAYCTE